MKNEDFAFELMPHCGWMEPHSILTVIAGLRSYAVSQLRAGRSVRIPGVCAVRRDGGRVTASASPVLKDYFKAYGAPQGGDGNEAGG